MKSNNLKNKLSHEEFLINSVRRNSIKDVKYSIKRCFTNKDLLSSQLSITTRYGYFDILKLLIDNGADIHFNNDEALLYAISNKYIEIVKYLLGLGASADLYHLNNALESDCIEIFKLLLPKIDQYNKNILFITAIFWNKDNFVKILVENGADVNYKNNSALLYEIEQCKTNMVDFLLNHGANVDKEIIKCAEISKKYFNEIYNNVIKHTNFKEKKRMSPDDYLIYSINNNLIRGVKSAIRQGAKFDITTITQTIKYCDNDIFKVLLPYIKSSDINSSFITAIYWVKNDIAKLLVENGADVNYQNSYALLYTAQQNNEEMVNFLIQHNAIVNDDIKKYLIEMKLLNVKNYVISTDEIVKLKIEKYNLKNKNIYDLIMNVKETNNKKINDDENRNYWNHVLIDSIEKNYIRYVNLSIENGADINFNNSEPLKLAIKNNNIEIVKYLMKNGAKL